MPTYAYRCPKCGHEFQKFQKMSDKTRPRCPKCKTKAERVITGGAGLVFKGSGFYITDYKKAGKTGEVEKADKAGKAAETSKAAGTGDKKKPSPKPKSDQ
jgi:putative FmdB family regulatory protein